MARNLYTLDNYLIGAGLALLLPTIGVLTSPLFEGTGALRAIPWLLACPTCLVLGYRIHARERRYLAIWSLLETAVEVPASDVVQNTSFDRDEIKQAIQAINESGKGFYVWETRNDTIVDGRLRTTVVAIERCSSCGAEEAQEFTLDLAHQAQCRFCGETFPADELSQLRAQSIARLRPSPRPQILTGAPRLLRTEGFNPGTFALLMVFFWPAALFYYQKHHSGVH